MRKTLRVTHAWNGSFLVSALLGKWFLLKISSLQDKFPKNVLSCASWIPVTEEWTGVFVVSVSQVVSNVPTAKPNLCELSCESSSVARVWGEGKCKSCGHSCVWWLPLSLCSLLPPQRTPPSSAPSWEMLQFLTLSGRGMCRWSSSTDRARQKYWWVVITCTGLEENIGLDRIPRHSGFNFDSFSVSFNAQTCLTTGGSLYCEKWKCLSCKD